VSGPVAAQRGEHRQACPPRRAFRSHSHDVEHRQRPRGRAPRPVGIARTLPSFAAPLASAGSIVISGPHGLDAQAASPIRTDVCILGSGRAACITRSE